MKILMYWLWSTLFKSDMVLRVWIGKWWKFIIRRIWKFALIYLFINLNLVFVTYLRNVFAENVPFSLIFILFAWIIISFKVTVPLFLNHAQVRVDRKTDIFGLDLSCEWSVSFLNFHWPFAFCHLKELLFRTILYHNLILILRWMIVRRIVRLIIVRIIILDTHF